MKIISVAFFVLFTTYLSFGQLLPHKQAYPLNVKQLHSGHSLTDPLFSDGHLRHLVGNILGGPVANIGKSTIPGSSMKHRWENQPLWGEPSARHAIANWELLSITEGVPLSYEGGSTTRSYLDRIQEQKQYLSLFVNNAWNNGNNRNGAPTLLWTTWTGIDKINSNGPWRQMLDLQGAEWERMQDYANANKPTAATPVFIIPGHKMMARLYDDIQLGKVPGITNINQFFLDAIHTNSLGNYAITMIHYACIYNKSPVGLTNNLFASSNTSPIPSIALATYLQTMIWEVVTSYPRTGISNNPILSVLPEGSTKENFIIYPNPVNNIVHLDKNIIDKNTQIRIYDTLGKLMYSGNELSIDVSQFPSGLYLLKYKTVIVKIVKQ
ncbi:hypothetical protein DR864_06245 [Runella rosea]|uniref:Secretion system C-terminal sorting domain-containing protein n=1 Tax=Runella rosea TaxID=2259595 RepID=A0A344TFD7_9BACT|nr:T9SS type A sorting domain-containing protein [Runella rosea]AXE17358.1 hypothetical protein DR864_06245 [Runella rosea]